VADDADRPAAERTDPEQVEDTTYQPRAPLWQPGRSRRTSPWTIAFGIVFVIALVPVLIFFSAPFLLDVPTGQVEVTIVRVVAGVPRDETPAAFRHLVTLPDGSRRPFVSDQTYSPGEKLLVTEYRSRLTGRRRLGGPCRMLAPPDRQRRHDRGGE
jgi:hypothetical protein